MRSDGQNSLSPDENNYYTDSKDHADDDVFFNYGSFPRTTEQNRNTESLTNFDDVRSRSLSLPYTCNARTYRHSISSFENHSKKNDKLKSSSTGNINNLTGETSIKFSSSIEESVATEKLCFGFTKRQVKCGFALCLLSVTDVMGFAIFAPFFPVAAQKKNLSSVQIGLVFSGFSMAGIFSSIITGTLLVRVGAKFIILAGMFWSAGATICFGLLYMAPPEYFFYLCFSCRVLMGIGSSAAFTALFAVIFQEFSDRALVMIGISESLCSIGGIIGPLIGGALYQFGGFLVPFAFLGVLQLIVLLVCSIMIPPVAVQPQANAVSPAWLLLNPHGLFAALFVIISFVTNSFITANISIFLIDAFHVSTFMVGVFLLIFSVFYGFSTPIWGYIAEAKKCGPHMMTFSCFIAGIALSLYGPADFWLEWFGWSAPRKWLVYVSTALIGTMMGALIMPTFGEMLVAAKQMKLQDNELAEYGLVSGLWNTVFSVGDILGPTVGGVMIDKYKFGNTCAIFGAVMCLLAVAKSFHLIYLACKKTSDDDDTKSEDNASEDSEERRGLLSPENSSLQA